MRALASLFLLLWFVIGVGFSSLFWLTPFATVEAGLRQPNLSAYFKPRPVPVSLARYTSLRVGMAAAVGLALATLLGLAKKRGPRPSGWRHLRAEWQQGQRRSLAAWRQLSPTQRAVASALGIAIIGVRGWLLVHCPITDDELTSYDCYVAPGLALAVSNYSLPNNHVLYNLLVGALGKVTSFGPDLLQRLPAVLIGVGSLPVGYVLLLRYVRFSAATLALGLFSFMPTPIFYAVAGRGYSLTLAATVAGFFATLVLLRAQRPPRLATVIFVLSGLAGLYAVPTYAWVVASYGLVLLVAYLRQPRRLARLRLAWLAAVTGGMLATAGMLYAPIGVLSGWPALFQNPYVASSLSWGGFWQGFYNPYLLDAASRLWGHGRWSTALLGGLAVLAPLLVDRVRPSLRPLVWLSYALTFLPVPLMLMQRSYLPPRTLLPSALGAYLLLVLLGHEAYRWLRLPRQVGGPASRALALFFFLIGYGAYHLHPEVKNVQVLAVRMAALRRQYAWLQARHPSRIWLDERSRAAQGIYWRHLGLLQHQPLPLIAGRNLPVRASGQAAEYAVCSPGSLPAWLATRTPAYRDEYIAAWQLAPAVPVVERAARELP